MNSTIGYIYLRVNESYNKYNAFKMGKATNIPERDNVYATGEIKRGHFVAVFEVPFGLIHDIECSLQTKYSELNVYLDAGREFYNKQIIHLIEPYLINQEIKYKKLSEEDINNLVTSNRVRKIIKKKIFKIQDTIKVNKETYAERDYQLQIIDKSVEYFKINNKGVLVLPCGVGKSLISLRITQKQNSNTIILGVPSILLLEQWKKYIFVLFEDFPCLFVYETITIEEIRQFLKDYNNKCIVITTYLSSYKVYNATRESGFCFNMKILDEVHHLTSTNTISSDNTETIKKYTQILKIISDKQLSLTATLKQIENNTNNRVVSNDNVEYFGEVIDRKCLLWAINENIICDYVIQTIITNEEQLEQQLSRFHIIKENDKRLFLSAFASLKSISDGHSHHLLDYSNNKENSRKLIQYITMLLDYNYFNISDLYYSDYDGEMKSKDQKEIINNFEKARFGIISCVYCLGEGWDFPLLDAVVFAENMSSNIRIVQSASRASRKNKHQPNKITKIILPILNRDDWLENNENSDLKKVRQVIYQMGLEDETISQKIKVFRISIGKPKPKEPNEPNTNEPVDDFGEYDDELTQRLRLKTVKRSALATSYEKARKIIADKNIKSKESYYELCERDIRLEKEPEIVFQGQFTNWIDYLSIERIYYDLETCKNKVDEYLSNETNIDFEFTNITKSLKILDDMFPPYDLWGEYYDINDLTEIIKHNKNEELVDF